MRRSGTDGPYNNLPLIPPSENIESERILKSCISAARALGELKGLVATVPEQKILLELLPLQESRSSSEIENIVSSRDRLFVALDNGKPNDNFTREVLRYNLTLTRHSHSIPDQNTIAAICSDLCGEPMRYRDSPEDEVFLVQYWGRDIAYIPPSGDNVSRLMKNLIEYIFTDDEIDPLIKMAVIHYQFEAIHPFFDGNGRTGRILNIMYLQYCKLLDEPILFLSQHIINNKSEYYRLLDKVTSNREWEPWIIFMLDAVRKTSEDTVRLVRKIRTLLTDARKIGLASGVPQTVIDSIFSNPFCTISRLQSDIDCSRPTATKYLRTLESAGLLSSIKESGKIIFCNLRLLDLFRA